MTQRTLTEVISDLEFQVAEEKAVLAAYPDANWRWYGGYNSKTVNQTYTNWEFEKTSYSLHVAPYCEVLFSHNGKDHIARVGGAPKNTRLCYVSWPYSGNKRKIKFARLKINLKNNGFKDDFLHACRIEIMSFVKSNPGYELDTKHLEPRLKELLSFV
jgi:hypothetical protein